MEKDKACLDLWRRENNGQALDQLILQYEAKVFSFVLYLSGCDTNTAYEITADSISEMLAELRSSSKEILSVPLFTRAVNKCRGIKDILSFDPIQFINAGEPRKNILRTAIKALSAMPFDQKALLLMRDQANLSHDEIASIMEVNGKEMKVMVGRARNLFRKKIEEQLNQ